MLLQLRRRGDVSNVRVLSASSPTLIHQSWLEGISRSRSLLILDDSGERNGGIEVVLWVFQGHVCSDFDGDLALLYKLDSLLLLEMSSGRPFSGLESLILLFDLLGTVHIIAHIDPFPRGGF